MTTEMMKFKRAYHELGNIAFKLKSKGHDMFVTYSPHVNGIEYRIHVNGWQEGADSDYNHTIYLNDGYLDYHHTVEPQMKILKKYIKELLDEKV